ncbi:YfcL family protein [Cronobacter sakazakii]|nr:YfcL family protein [Cronobacter sakazakii]KAB0868370.1 YfcL family protein [Cronobacter sakazakii]HAU5461342.1 YfcL family protein [Cronobacter sakazakii]
MSVRQRLDSLFACGYLRGLADKRDAPDGCFLRVYSRYLSVTPSLADALMRVR